MNRVATWIFSLVISMLLAVNASAQDFQTGFDAFKRGDYDEAVEQWRVLSSEGDTRAKLGLARTYSKISYGKQDFAEAVRLYKQAAEDGSYVAMSDLAELYFFGRGVKQDEVEAMMWFELAQSHGSALGSDQMEVLGTRMTTEQIDEAKRRKLEWMSENAR